jgi:acyl-CoA synthetase (NDP forming)
MYNLDKLIYPETVAVIGVSLSNDRHPANVIYNKNHLRYPVKVFPVNPKGGFIHKEKVYKSISEIQEDIDLAVIAVRADFVPDIIKECINKKVGGSIVISGGFSEVGNIELQNEIVKLARDNDFPFIGPNCLGLYNPSIIDSLFLPAERIVTPETGGVAVISQSGGILIDQMVKFKDEGIGMSVGISIGNKALIKETELLNYFENNEQTKVIAFYIEGFGKDEGRRFVEAAEKCSKPVVVLKSGKTSEGSRAVSSHTASVAGDYKVFSEILKQKGIIEATNDFEFVSYCEALECFDKAIGNQIGIITGSGGHGAIAVDFCKKYDFNVPLLENSDKEKLKDSLSPNIKNIVSLSNPIDLTGSATDRDFTATAEYLAKLSYIDAIIVLLLPYLPGISMDLSVRLSNICKNFDKPLVAYMPHVDKYQMLMEGFKLNNIPVSPSVEGAVLMAKALRGSK